MRSKTLTVRYALGGPNGSSQKSRPTTTNSLNGWGTEMFRTLTTEEEQAFRAWARSNYEPLDEIRGTWHPVVQAECVQINAEWVARVEAYVPVRGDVKFICNNSVLEGDE